MQIQIFLSPVSGILTREIFEKNVFIQKLSEVTHFSRIFPNKFGVSWGLNLVRSVFRVFRITNLFSYVLLLWD